MAEKTHHTSHHSHQKSKKIDSRIMMWSILAVLLLVSVWYIAGNASVSDDHMTKPSVTPQPTNQATQTIISEEEKNQIDEWITTHDLNEYGDPKDTVYAGGTPLFNEMTGESMDVYEYILKQHPDRPWQQ